jgi:Outer membrane protein beta-barrel domain
MKKSAIYLLSLFALIVLEQKVQAQTLLVGLKGGISIPNLTSGGSDNNPLNTGYSSILGADGAIFGQYGISDVFSLELSAEYSKQGGKKNGNQALPVPAEFAGLFPPGEVPPYLWATIDAQANLDYLLVPLLAKFTFAFSHSSPLSWHVDAGPFVGFVLSAKIVTTGTSNVYEDQAHTMPLLSAPISLASNTDIKSQLHTANFGVEGNIGLDYALGRSAVFVEVGGNYGFIPIQKSSANGQNNTGAAVARLGFSYQLGQ